MKIKTLLLGSAAALVAVSGARAADAVVIPEPELVEYVRVCDTYGTGFFYIPGTETCLRISGHVRYEMNLSSQDWEFTPVNGAFNAATGAFAPVEIFAGVNSPSGTTVVGALQAIAEAGGDITAVVGGADFPAAIVRADNNDGWNKRADVQISIDARNETELGTLVSVIRLNADDNPRRAEQDIAVERAYIQLAGFTVGKQATFWDYQVGADGDGLFSGGPGAVGMVAYTANVGGFGISLSLEEDETADFVPDVVFDVSGSVGDFMLRAGVAYNESASAFSGKITGQYDFGPATVSLGYQYSEEESLGAEYLSNFEHVIGADVAADLTDKLSARAGLNYGMNWFGTNEDVLRIGAGINYELVSGFAIDARVTHDMHSNGLEAVGITDFTTGRIRFTRTF